MDAVASRNSPVDLNAPDWVHHAELKDWVASVAQLTQPDRIEWCDGSQAEYYRLCEQMVAAGMVRETLPARYSKESATTLKAEIKPEPNQLEFELKTK